MDDVTRGEFRLITAQPHFWREARIKDLEKRLLIFWDCCYTKFIVLYTLRSNMYSFIPNEQHERHWWVTCDHTQALGKMHTFSCVCSLQVLMDEEAKAHRNWITYPGLYSWEPRFELKSDTRDYVQNFYPTVVAYMTASLNSCSSLISPEPSS